jgi:hypothetical protein
VAAKAQQEVGKMKKGLILITFAWTVEAFGVLAGLVTAIVTNFPAFAEGDFNESWWKLLYVPPMAMIAVAELGRIPMTSILYQRNTRMQIIAVVGILVLAGIAFENWFFGFERIVELRLKPVSAAVLVQSRKEDELADKEKQRAEAATAETQVREEFRKEREANEEAIASENEAHQKNVVQITASCRLTPRGDQCMITKLEDESRRHNDVMGPLLKQRDDINKQVKERVKTTTKELDAEISKLRLEVTAAKKDTKEQKAQNQIYRIAAMVYWVEGGVSKVTDHQFEVIRLWFCAFSALALSLVGTVAALVYYAADRVPTKYGPIGKMIAGIRAYFARLRGRIYVTRYRDVKIVEVPKPVVVRQPYLVFVPWFFKYPMQIGLKDGKVQIKKVEEVE